MQRCEDLIALAFLPCSNRCVGSGSPASLDSTSDLSCASSFCRAWLQQSGRKGRGSAAKSLLATQPTHSAVPVQPSHADPIQTTLSQTLAQPIITSFSCARRFSASTPVSPVSRKDVQHPGFASKQLASGQCGQRF